ncbi:MAG: cardiolipin synthase [Terrimonas sp.]|nr:cardiolipin synthase [Terrimonas sp.]OJY81256.1 MAG: cardiolipin synthase [Sphingobacteriales bacterium 40-81]
MNWLLLFEILYIIALILVCFRIIYDTQNNIKTLAYLLLVVFIPVIGAIIYFSFGINYRKRRMYDKKLVADDVLAEKIRIQTLQSSQKTYNENKALLESNRELAYMLVNGSMSTLTGDNDVKLLINGESKFPEVIAALEKAKHHIHIEYYIFEDDEIGKTVEEILIRKAKEGVEVRFIYDDFGSRSIRRTLSRRLRSNHVQTFPFHKIIFVALANRLNYRNHRKIIVIDGTIGFIGGINVSDRYINAKENKLFWRDTHLYIQGSGVRYLQYLFMCDWNFCAQDHLKPNDVFFPEYSSIMPKAGNKIVQIAASGPDSEVPVILFSILQAINLATQEILITTPYFIPGESVIDALLVSAMGGVKVKILVPDKSDSIIVNAAARSYYGDLARAGIEIYLYRKGFVHAKTLVADRKLSVVGTANMDYRSFDLNFEVNAIVYDKEIANQMADVFYNDIKDAELVDIEKWDKRPLYKEMIEKTARLISPLL